MELRDIEAAIEGILFASGEPVSAERLCRTLELDRAAVESVASRLADHYSYERRGIRLRKLEGAYQLCSAPECAEWIRKALEVRKPAQLSPPALEVLTIVAYFQPVTRAYIDQVRGVDSSYTVGLLAERGLIEENGRLAVPGRPLLYRTTRNFLRVFNLASLDELPPLPDDPRADGQLTLGNLASGERTSEEESPEAVGAALP